MELYKKNSPRIIYGLTDEKPNLDLDDLMLTEKSEITKNRLVFNDVLQKLFDRIVFEYYQRNELRSHGFDNIQKILFLGVEGSGKKFTAHALANALHLPIRTIHVERVTLKHEFTIVKLLDFIKQNPAVYFFDISDFIGRESGPYLINIFLRFAFEQKYPSSLIVVSNLNEYFLSFELLQKFDACLSFVNPGQKEIKQLILNKLGFFLKPPQLDWNLILNEFNKLYLSYADISKLCNEALKNAILNYKKIINTQDLLESLSLLNLQKYSIPKIEKEILVDKKEPLV